MVTPLREILETSAKAWGLEPAARLVAIRRAWPRIVGRALVGASAPLGIRAGRLRVAVLQGTAAQEIRIRGAAIVSAVNREIGEPVVREVVTIPRRALPNEQGRRDPRLAGPRKAR